MIAGRCGTVALGAAVAAALAAACETKSKPAGPGDAPVEAAPIESAATDPLWALAPPGMQVGLVVADGAGPSIHAAMVILVRALERSPVTTPLAREIRRSLAVGGVDPLDPAALASLGMDLRRGMAVFASADGPVAVLPVGDRAKLVAAVGGAAEPGGIDRLKGDTFCKDVGGRYACATRAAQLDSIGKGGGAALVASWAAELRGSVEMYAGPDPLASGPLRLLVENGTALRVGARLERGGATVRLHLAGTPSALLAGARTAAPSHLLAGVAESSPAGFLIVQGSGVWKARSAELLAGVPPSPLPGGVALNELVGSLDGDLLAYAPAGSPERAVLRIGLTRPEPAMKLLAACAELGRLGPGWTFAKKGEHCEASAPNAVFGLIGPGDQRSTIDLFVDGGIGALVIGFGQHQAVATAPAALPAFARELLSEPRLFAGWGRGSTIGSPNFSGEAHLVPMRGMAVSALLFWLERLNELGFWLRVEEDGLRAALRVRSLWANPDDVLAEVDKVLEASARGDADAGAQVTRLTRRFPDAPLTRDIAAGPSGLAIQLVPVLLAPTALPAWSAAPNRAP